MPLPACVLTYRYDTRRHRNALDEGFVCWNWGGKAGVSRHRTKGLWNDQNWWVLFCKPLYKSSCFEMSCYGVVHSRTVQAVMLPCRCGFNNQRRGVRVAIHHSQCLSMVLLLFTSMCGSDSHFRTRSSVGRSPGLLRESMPGFVGSMESSDSDRRQSADIAQTINSMQVNLELNSVHMCSAGCQAKPLC